MNLSNMVASPEALTEVSEIKHDNPIDVLTNSDVFSAPLIQAVEKMKVSALRPALLKKHFLMTITRRVAMCLI